MVACKKILVLCLLIVALPALSQTHIYDVVISGGRVMDPETKLDAVRNIGINGNKIAAISEVTLQGRKTIDAKGLVVSPGFIDLHIHGRTNKEQEYQLHDGLTTALELEWGIEHLGAWYKTREGKALINYGASVNWPFERYKAIAKYKAGVNELLQITNKGESLLEKLIGYVKSSYADTLTPAEMEITLANIKATLAEGAIGIGVPIGYLPKTPAREMYSVYEMAGQMKTLVFSHVREPNMISIQEVIANAMLTGAPLHIVHINSMALANIDLAIGMVQTAQQKGFDITTELYPYTAASTLLESAIFNDGWQQRLGMDYGDIQWVATGERLTKETYEKYKKQGGTAILHMMKPEWIKKGIAWPGVIVGSDGMPYAPLAHPRTAGTFSRVLAKYVREEKVIDLMTAIEKMSLLPAKRLEDIAPSMKYKGRLQVGADADITVFDPNTIQDNATFEKGLAFSTGVQYVLVNGVLALDKGKTVANTMAGQPIYGKFKK